MMTEGDPSKKCGDCIYFYPKDRDGQPFSPKLTRDKIYVIVGVCRNFKAGGLTLMNLTEETLCKRPEFFFPRVITNPSKG